MKARPAEIVASREAVVVTLDGAVSDQERLTAAVELAQRLAVDAEAAAKTASPYR